MSILKKIYTIFNVALIVGVFSCQKTIDAIKIERVKSDIPSKIVYNSKYKKITGGKFYFTYKITNSSFAARYLIDACYYSGLARKTSFMYDYNLNKIPVHNKVVVEKSGSELIVVEQLFSKKDTIIDLDFKYMKLDSIYFRNSDTIKVYNYLSFDEIKKNMPDLLEFYLKKDSIRFEFDDAELPFYVKRSKSKMKYSEEAISSLPIDKQELLKRKMDKDGFIERTNKHTWITVPILED